MNIKSEKHVGAAVTVNPTDETLVQNKDPPPSFMLLALSWDNPCIPNSPSYAIKILAVLLIKSLFCTRVSTIVFTVVPNKVIGTGRKPRLGGYSVSLEAL